MPRERRDLTSIIIADKANQTNEEIIVQLDNKDKKEQDEYNKLESEFIRNSNKYTENGYKEIQARLAEEHARESERYILQNTLLLCSYVWRTSIAGKITVQVDADVMRSHFGDAQAQSAYQLTLECQRIGTLSKPQIS